MTVILKDTYTRGDNTDLGNTEIGLIPWEVYYGSWVIQGNKLVSTYTASDSFACVESGISNGVITCTFSTVVMRSRLAFRISDNRNLWFVQAYGTEYRLYKMVDFTTYNLASTAITPTNGDIIKVEAKDSTIKVYINGTLRITLTDTFNQTATKHGVGVGAASGAQFDDFTVEDFNNNIVMNGLIGYWNAKRGLGTTWQNIAPATAGRYNGAFVGGVVKNADNVALNGSTGLIDIGAIQAGDKGTAFEVEMHLLAPFDGSGGSYGLMMPFSTQTTGDATCVVVGVNGTTVSMSDDTKSFNTTIPKNTIFKLNYSVDVTTKQETLYINDVQVGQEIDPYVVNHLLAVVFGAISNASSSFFFKGSIYSSKIYNRILTPAERAQNSLVGTNVGLTKDFAGASATTTTAGAPNLRRARKVSGASATTTTAGAADLTVTKKSSGYLQMNGTTDYMTLPSMTIDRVEMDMLTDPVSNSGSHYIYDSRPTADKYALTSGNGLNGWSSVTVNGSPVTNGTLPSTDRFTYVFQSATAYTAPASIFTRYNLATSYCVKGNIYRIRCYNGATLVADYDMSKGNVQDQSGNGNHATLVGGTFVGATTPTHTVVYFTGSSNTVTAIASAVLRRARKVSGTSSTTVAAASAVLRRTIKASGTSSNTTVTTSSPTLRRKRAQAGASTSTTTISTPNLRRAQRLTGASNTSTSISNATLRRTIKASGSSNTTTTTSSTVLRRLRKASGSSSTLTSVSAPALRKAFKMTGASSTTTSLSSPVIRRKRGVSGASVTMTTSSSTTPKTFRKFGGSSMTIVTATGILSVTSKGMVILDFSGASVTVTTVSKPILRKAQKMSGSATETTSVSSPVMKRIRGIRGSASINTVATNTVFRRAQKMGGSSATTSATSAPILRRTRQEVGASITTSTTSTPNLRRQRAFSGASFTTVYAYASNGKTISFSGDSSTVTDTSAPMLKRLMKATGSSNTLVTLSLPNFQRIRGFGGTSMTKVNTSDALLQRMLALRGDAYILITTAGLIQYKTSNMLSAPTIVIQGIWEPETVIEAIHRMENILAGEMPAETVIKGAI